MEVSTNSQLGAISQYSILIRGEGYSYSKIKSGYKVQRRILEWVSLRNRDQDFQNFWIAELGDEIERCCSRVWDWNNVEKCSIR